MRSQYNCHRQCEIGFCPSACGPEGFCYFGSQKDSSKIVPVALVKQSLLINSKHITTEESKCFRPVDEAQITWLNGKLDCETECHRLGGGPCPNACGKRGYCCKRPESTDEEIGSCPDIAKWSVLPVHDSKWRCVAPPGGFVDDSIDEERGKSHPINFSFSLKVTCKGQILIPYFKNLMASVFWTTNIVCSNISSHQPIFFFEALK